MPRPNQLRRVLIAAAVLCGSAMSLAGCATWQGPRIDPTGQRFFVWPGDPQSYMAAPTVVGPAPVVVSPPPGAPVVSTAPDVQPLPSVVPSSPFGNLVAPPVYSDPPLPPIPTAPVAAAPPMGAVPVSPMAASVPVLPLPPPPGMVPSPMMPVNAAVPPGVDHLQTMPTVLIAPVGREMLLKGTIVGGDGRLLVARHIDWNIAPNGTAQFTEMGFRDRAQMLSWWEAPHRFDALSATSATATFPITLNTATDDPNDDIPILRGESWVTLTSPVEGSSVVTAFAPSLDCYNQSSTTIYWIDAQWVFNQAVVAEAGRPYTLTTTVMRRTDGAPLAGWIVRYDVAGAGAGLGYEGGASTEATTDAAGRASVEVSPREAGGGLTNVGITIIRPATGGPAPMPRLELGRGATAITWDAAGIPITPPPALPGGPSAPFTPVPLPPPPGAAPAPSLPASPYTPAPAAPPASPPAATTPQQQDPYVPPAAAAATGKPRLEVDLQPGSQDKIAVGQNVTFELTVTNRGDGIAQHIRVVDNFDRGLRHPAAQPNEYKISYDGMRDLPPGESETLRLTFQVVDGGMQCHEATVTADGAEPVTSRRACVTAGQGAIDVTTNAPRRQVVGETAKINAVVKNVGETAATHIEIVARCDAALAPSQAEEGHVTLPNGDILLRVDRLEPGERRTFRMEVLCKAPSNNACTRFIVTADGGVTAAADACMEVLPQLSTGAPGGAAAPATGPGDLRLTVDTTANPGRVGNKHLINAVIRNAGDQTERKVYVRVAVPAEFQIDTTQIQPAGEAEVRGQEVRFAEIAELGPGQSKQYVIPITPLRTGQVQVVAEVAASGLSTPKKAMSELVEIMGASQ